MQKGKTYFRVLCLAVLFVMVAAMFAGCGQQAVESADGSKTLDKTADQASTAVKEEPRENVELEVLNILPEYQPQYEQIWAKYTEKNPNVKIRMTGMTEGQETAMEARIAAGDPPDIEAYCPKPNKDNYTRFYNLLNIDYPYWDKLKYDPKQIWADQSGITGYLPSLGTQFSFALTFMYYQDEMEKTGLKPKETVKTWDDLEKFMQEFKKYVDANPDIEYVCDEGYDGGVWGDWFPALFSYSLGSDLQVNKDLFTGKIRWDDMEKNPYVKVYEKFKEWYDKGYFPKNFWTRAWETDFEAAFVAKKSILCFHGPWLWDKVLAANPQAKLDGFPLPAFNGKVLQTPISIEGSAIFAAHEKESKFKETVKAFIWWNSPEAVKMQVQVTNNPAAMDLSSVGGDPVLKGMQYNQVIKAVNDGVFGNVAWDAGMWGFDISMRYKKEGKPNILSYDTLASELGAYMEGKLTIEGFMKNCQKRADDGYTFAN